MRLPPSAPSPYMLLQRRLDFSSSPSSERGKHLFDVQVPMLFLQGTRDALADVQHLQPLCSELGKSATLRLLDGADHSFHVLVRSGRTDVEVGREMLDALEMWIEQVILPSAAPL